MEICVGLITFIVFFVLQNILIKSLNKNFPLYIFLGSSLVSYIATLLMFNLSDKAINIYPYSSFYWFLVMGFLFYYFSLNKSVSVRILTDLLDSDQKELEYNNLLNSYLTQDSFLNRLDVLLNRNLIVHKKNEYKLTKKGRRVASLYIKFQKLFLIKNSG